MDVDDSRRFALWRYKEYRPPVCGRDTLKQPVRGDPRLAFFFLLLLALVLPVTLPQPCSSCSLQEFTRGMRAMLFEAHNALIASNAWLLTRLQGVEVRTDCTECIIQ